MATDYHDLTETGAQLDTKLGQAHIQNSDTMLDENGDNPITAAELVTLKNVTVPAKVEKLLLETSEKTANHVLEDGDQDKVVLMNKVGAGILTIPTNDSVPFAIGTVIGGYNISSDLVTIEGAVGVIVRNAGDIPQYGEVSIRKRDTDEWVVAGVVL